MSLRHVPEFRRSAQVDDFVAFALSKRAQPVTTSVGFISLNFEEGSANYTAERERSKNLIGTPATRLERRATRTFSQTIAGVQRLSVTFRFNTNSTDLDSRALKDIDRLAAYINANRDRARRIMLFGFADSREGLTATTNFAGPALRALQMS
jgi:phosphate transport system substrate-binding protein